MNLIASLALLANVHTQALTTISRGQDGFWDVSDTTIDATRLDEPLGWQYVVEGGPGKAILIRFGKVAVDSNQVTLELAQTGGDAPELISVSVLKAPFLEGPWHSLSMIVQKPEPGAKPPPAKGSTFLYRDIFAKKKWQNPGAVGPEDSQVLRGCSIVNAGDNRWRILGLKAALANSSDFLKNGLLLRFAKPVEFASSKSRPELRPKLLCDGSNFQFASNGLHDYISAVLFKQCRFSFALNGVENFPTEALKNVPADAVTRENTKSALASFGLRDLSLFDPYKIAIQYPEFGRVSGAAFQGLMDGGDTRFDGLVPSQFSLMPEAVYSPILESAIVEPTGLLSGFDVGQLQQLAASGMRDLSIPLPTNIVVRATDSFGNPLPSVQVEGFRMSGGKFETKKPLFKTSTGPNGTFILQSGIFNGLTKNLDNGMYMFRLSLNGQVASSPLTIARVAESYYRGNKDIAIFDARFLIPKAPVSEDRELIGGKTAVGVSDDPLRAAALSQAAKDLAAGKPAVLNALPGDAIEFDLGRDRPIGEVKLEGSLWKTFDILVYATGDKPEDAATWSRELDSTIPRTDRAYFGNITRARYLRLVCRSAGQATLTKVAAYLSPER